MSLEQGAVLDKAGAENFPVAPFFMPRSMRAGLMAVYGFARLVDDVGDGDLADPRATARLLGVPLPETEPQPALARTAPEPVPSPAAAAGAAAPDEAETRARLALLDAIESDLDRAFDTVLGAPGTQAPRHPLLAALCPVIDLHGLTPEPFRALIQANRVDQTTSRYATFDDLMGYCELSANPVGRLVLQLAGLATPERVRRSDAVCSALQVVEHLQDVAEDRARDRIYLPAEDMARFGVAEADLDAPHAGPALRALVEYEAGRARALLAEGAPLVGSVGGRLRLLLAGFVAGGGAALQAVADAGNDVLAGAPKPRKGRLLREAAVTLVKGR
ncbi:squalene synthase HpnC [Streptacidiphilus sp. PB12-B1b]|uniref:squalene synthase HpnC n=1 Tax=Streptacidiphilus sp. PB12-B1b TaxID=2705012 RepID=UPI001CDC077E|nr:squalene synthase HpnC [Streptacidiphilus sp. PB12-B1b]